ncbi:hypothetical protein CANMA_000325 [Candida margitis]|uniref:uncharacterized protein n=1 Tax=Candida margitis TaxID=1775924 RepID=UPI002226F7C3|nr:uncharacterized protein CANMA_000325 [Candida margitis]KAI5970629.1 hypothetical protein CANMA_000325 [Candida margitis]
MIVIKQTMSMLNKVLPNAVNPLPGSETTTKTSPSVVTRSRAGSSSNRRDHGSSDPPKGDVAVHNSNSLQRGGSLGHKKSTSKSKSRSNQNSHNSRSRDPLPVPEPMTVSDFQDLNEKTNHEDSQESAQHLQGSSISHDELNSFEWLLICIIILLLFIIYMTT